MRRQMDGFGRYPYTPWDFFPETYACPHDIQRLGRLGDGGKWVYGMSLYEAKPGFAISNSFHKDLVTPRDNHLSFGVNDESTFEAEMLGRIPSAQMLAFNFSKDKFGPQLPLPPTRREHTSIKWDWEVRTSMTKNPQFFTLSSAVAQKIIPIPIS
jgi:hypothetical protein